MENLFFSAALDKEERIMFNFFRNHVYVDRSVSRSFCSRTAHGTIGRHESFLAYRGFQNVRLQALCTAANETFSVGGHKVAGLCRRDEAWFPKIKGPIFVCRGFTTIGRDHFPQTPTASFASIIACDDNLPCCPFCSAATMFCVVCWHWLCWGGSGNLPDRVCPACGSSHVISARS
jgi:hypothetical protein